MDEKTIFTYENTIGKLTFKYDSSFWIDLVDGASSVEVDISEVRSPHQIGATLTNESIRPRSMIIDGSIRDPVDINRRKLIEVMAPQYPSTLTCKRGEESWYLSVIPEKTPEISPGNAVQDFQVQLYAAYPLWRTTASYATQVVGLIPLFQFPFYTGGTWYISRFSEDYFKTITNKGNAPMGFEITITARSAVSNPEIYHVDTGQRISIRKDLVTGEKIVISTIFGNRGVTVITPNGEATNGYKYTTVESDLGMQLLPGDNLIHTDAEYNREGLSVRINAPEGVRTGV